MKLLITRSPGKNNAKPNIEKLEMLSTEFNNITFNINDNDIPIIIFTDTEESFFINKMYDKITRLESLLEFEILQSDLVAITSGGGGTSAGSLQITGGAAISSVLQRVTDGNNTGVALWLSTNSITNFGPAGSATSNVVFGRDAMLNSTSSATANVAMGSSALLTTTAGVYNTAIGAASMRSWNDPDAGATRGQNVAIGAFSQWARTSGKWNVAVGASAMQNGDGGSFNAVFGTHTGETLTGSWNTCIGTYAGTNITGSNNLVIGSAQGVGGITTGSNNIIVNGLDARTGITTGSNNVIIGGFTTITNASDQVVIGTGNGVRRIWFDSVGQMTITTAPTTGTGATTEKILVRDTAAGAIKQVDYVATNATVSALSAATLNATYTTATIGFRVICMSIAGGALMYIKTGASTWASTPLTAVV